MNYNMETRKGALHANTDGLSRFSYQEGGASYLQPTRTAESNLASQDLGPDASSDDEPHVKATGTVDTLSTGIQEKDQEQTCQ